MASDKELLTARIFLRAALPVTKVMVADVPAMQQRFRGTTARVQFLAKDPVENVGAWLDFSDGNLNVMQGIADKADLTFQFSSVAKMNAMFAGKPVLPRIKGITRVGLLMKVMSLLMGLKILMPNAKPKSPDQARLKVKMTLYMVAAALSQLNKAGDPEMVKWTTKQPERVYQWSCEPEGIACYLRVKAGKTQAGSGYYTRRKPFVHMRFNGVDNAMPILSNSIDIVQAMAKGHVSNEGSPEYAGQVGDFMLKIASLVS